MLSWSFYRYKNLIGNDILTLYGSPSTKLHINFCTLTLWGNLTRYGSSTSPSFYRITIGSINLYTVNYIKTTCVCTSLIYGSTKPNTVWSHMKFLNNWKCFINKINMYKCIEYFMQDFHHLSLTYTTLY